MASLDSCFKKELNGSLANELQSRAFVIRVHEVFIRLMG